LSEIIELRYIMSSWYTQSKHSEVSNRIHLKAGWKENSALAGLVFLLLGMSLQEASEKSNATEEEINQAAQNPDYAEEARSIAKEYSSNDIPTQMPSDNYLYELIKSYEDSSNQVYIDPLGYPILGIGFNMKKEGAYEKIKSIGANFEELMAGVSEINDEQIFALFQDDLETAKMGASNFVSNFDELPTIAKTVLIDMVFNIGATGLSEFNNLRSELEKSNYAAAAEEMKNSKWYGQTRNRAKSAVQMMRHLAELSNKNSV